MSINDTHYSPQKDSSIASLIVVNAKPATTSGCIAVVKKFVTIPDMETREILNQLEQIAQQVEFLRRSLMSEGTPSTEAQKKAGAGLCTYCGKPLGSEAETRGAHHRCYRKAMRRIEQLKTTDDELVSAGLLLPPGKPGRKIDGNDPALLAEESRRSREKAKAAAEAAEIHKKAREGIKQAKKQKGSDA